MTGDRSRAEERVSLHGLTPEEALRALLAVDPENVDDGDDENGQDGSTSGR
jgi:hypothetical protein